MDTITDWEEGSRYAVTGASVLFLSDREVVGKCSRCGASVTENKQGFFCENEGCKCAFWKNNKFFTLKKKQLTKAVAVSLLKDGKVPNDGMFF